MSYFSDLYAPLRTLLGDTGAVAMYSTAQLDMGIYNGLLADVADGGGFSEGTAVGLLRTITPSFSAYADIYRLSLRAAIALIAPTASIQRYQTKVLSVTRDTGAGSLLSYLRSELRRVRDGTLTITSQTEWDVYLRGTATAVSKLSSFPG